VSATTSETSECENETAPIDHEPEVVPDGGNGRVTAAQLGKLRELVHQIGGEWSAFRTHVRTSHGVNIEYASRRLASTLIEELLERTRQRKSNGTHRAERRPT
jgi:hypothetical protein